MSERLPVVTGKQVAKVAVKLGFVFDRQNGSHAVYIQSTSRTRIVIPMHSGTILKPKTLTAIIEDMGTTVQRFRDLL